MLYNAIAQLIQKHNSDSPDTIILGSGVLERIKKEMKKHYALGLGINRRGQCVSLFGLKIVVDVRDENNVAICKTVSSIIDVAHHDIPKEKREVIFDELRDEI